MPKDKKKNQKGKADKTKTGAAKVNKAKKRTAAAAAKAPKKVAKNLQALTQNPFVADVVAAALVAMASALKDSDKARQLANETGDQLNALSKASARRGNAMWDLALDIGRRTMDTLADEKGGRGKAGKSR